MLKRWASFCVFGCAASLSLPVWAFLLGGGAWGCYWSRMDLSCPATSRVLSYVPSSPAWVYLLYVDIAARLRTPRSWS